MFEILKSVETMDRIRIMNSVDIMNNVGKLRIVVESVLRVLVDL